MGTVGRAGAAGQCPQLRLGGYGAGRVSVRVTSSPGGQGEACPGHVGSSAFPAAGAQALAAVRLAGTASAQGPH